jgi:DME family drug/metabolite transporter
MAWSFVVAAVFAVAFVVPSSLDWLATPSGPVTVAYLGLATISVAYLLYARSLSRLAGSMVVTLTLVEPVTATALGALVLDESIRAVSWAGAALVVAALVVAGTSTD